MEPYGRYMAPFSFVHTVQIRIYDSRQNLPITSSVILFVATINGVVIIIISHSITLPSSFVLNSGMW